MRVGKVSRNTLRLLLVAIVGLVLASYFSIPAQAQTNPVDLVLDSAGITPWVISNIKPGDSGNKTVTLSNVGSGDGFVTIWLSDIISSEGLNPEAETGNTDEPGEVDKHLQLNLTAEGLSIHLDLPAKINKMPHSATAANTIEIIPLKKGANVELFWEWELPWDTSNEAQGDSISFTINYLLREFEITDLSDVVTEEGTFEEDVIIGLEDNNTRLIIEEGIVGQTEGGDPISEIWIIDVEKESLALPQNKVTIGGHILAGPEGTSFDQPITLTTTYNPDDIPPRANLGDLCIALWNETIGEWVELTDCVVNSENNTISAQVSHFSRYSILARVPPPPPPPVPIVELSPELIEEEEKEEFPQTTEARLEINMLGQESTIEIASDGTLSESLRLTDPSGDFIIDIDGGTKITNPSGIQLSQIELTVAGELIIVPDEIAILSPTYKITGYTRTMAAVGISFDPTVTLTIKYNPENLPENLFPPFIATYINDEGLVPLQAPLDSTVGLNEAKALINHASLFVVAAVIAPPPPPLPARFKASNLNINPQQAQLGQSVTISLTITNEDALEGSSELHLIIDGIVQIVEKITLDGKDSRTLTFEISNLAVGNHQVKIAGLTEQFSIVMLTTPPSEVETDWLMIDLSVGAAFILGAFGLYFIIRRSRKA